MKIVRVETPAGPRFGILSASGREIELCDGDVPWALVPAGERIPLAAVRLLAPCQPTKIVGVGQNYRAHARELGKPVADEPVLFLKPPTAVAAPGEPIRRPRGFERVDYEGELAVVIGRRGRNVPAEAALDLVLGYTVLNDVTVRDLQKKDGQWTRAKGFDGFAPLGPCIATGLDPGDLMIETRLNGEVRQRSSTSDMVFPVPRLLAAISRVMTLLPGDVVTTGTPSGVGPLAPGDVVEVEIAGIGALENPVVDEDEPRRKESE